MQNSLPSLVFSASTGRMIASNLQQRRCRILAVQHSQVGVVATLSERRGSLLPDRFVNLPGEMRRERHASHYLIIPVTASTNMIPNKARVSREGSGSGTVRSSSGTM